MVSCNENMYKKYIILYINTVGTRLQVHIYLVPWFKLINELQTYRKLLIYVYS